MSDKNLIDIMSDDLKFNKKKFILIILTLLLFFFGYVIAPDPIPDGNYIISIDYSSNLQTEFNIQLDSDIDFPLNKIVYNVSVGSTILEISFFQIYPGKIGNSVFFDITVFSDNSIDGKDFSGVFSNTEKIMDFSSSSIIDNTVFFEFRILKHSDVALGLLLAISFLWLTELIPLAASSLIIPVIIVLSRIDNATGAFANFANPIIFLFLSGFLMAEAMDRSGLDKYLSLRIIAFVPPRPRILMITFMSLSAIFSMFMSNTAAVAILIPIALTMLESADIEDENYKKAMVLGIAYSATVGGIGTMIGTAPNIIAVEFIKEYDPALDINFLEWMMFGVPVVLLMIPLIFIYLWFKFNPNIKEDNLIKAKQKALDEVSKQRGMTLDQKIVSIIFALIIGLWLSTQLHGISASVIAVIGAMLFFFTGQIKQEDLQSIGWPTLITFGGGLSLGYVIIETGLADYIAIKLSMLGNLPIMITTTIIALVALFLTAIASNTASAAILIPIAMPLAVILGINPVLLAVLIAISCSLDFAIVIGTPPTMMAYNTGLYKVKEIFNIGIILDLIGLFVVLILSWTLFMFLVLIV